MFRQASLRAVAAARTVRLQHTAPKSRSLVSTVLLNRSWENETVVSLRAELQKRGLSQRGNKTTLITRIREFEEHQTSPAYAEPSSPAQAAQTRSASTAAAAPSVPASSPPPPPASPAPRSPAGSDASSSSATSYPVEIFDVKLPDLSALPAEPPVQIPLSFDMYESAESASASADSAPTHDIPKILVVGGESAHVAASNMLPIADISIDDAASADAPLEANTATGLRALAYDMLDDLGLPRRLPLAIPAVLKTDAGLVPDTQQDTVSPRTRELTGDERWGAAVLVASLFGAWALAGVFAPKPAREGAHDEGSEKH